MQYSLFCTNWFKANEYMISVYSGSSPALAAASSSAVSSSGSSKSNKRGLSFDCSSDFIQIYDGKDAKSAKLAEFCGSGHLNSVTSSGSSALVVLYSAPASVMSDSRLELDVTVDLNAINETYIAASPGSSFLASSPLSSSSDSGSSSGSCDYLFEGRDDKTRSGIIRSPSHSMPGNSSCSFRFRSDNPDDRIWLYFVSYFVQDLNEYGNEERCDLTSIELRGVLLDPDSSLPWMHRLRHHQANDQASFHDSGGKGTTTGTLGVTGACNQTSSKSQSGYFSSPSLTSSSSLTSSVQHSSPSVTVGGTRSLQSSSSPKGLSSGVGDRRFCEKSSPVVCGRTADFEPNFLPSKPCSLPDESYLSNGPEFILQQHHYRPTAFFAGGSGSSFAARFEFIDMSEQGDPVDGTLCDRWVFSHKNSRGVIRSTHNTFLFGRGGHRDLSCSFKFVSKKNERLRLHVTSLRLDSSACRHHRDSRNGVYSCHSSTDSSNSHDKSERLGRLTVLDSIKSTQSSDTEQINVGCFCSSFTSKEDNTRQEVRKTGQSNRKIHGSLTLNDDTTNNNHIMEGNLEEQATEFGEESDQDFVTFDLIGPEVILNLTVIGMTSMDDFNNFGFEARYEFLSESEFSSYNRILDCKYKCPELNYCISPDLWCDGVTHCPSGYDELPSQCRRHKVVWIASITAAVAVILALITAAGILLRLRVQRRRRHKHHQRDVLPRDIPIHFGDGLNIYHQPHPAILQDHYPTAFRCSTSSTYLRPMTGPALSVGHSSSSRSSEQDFLPSEREFDFRAFRSSGTATTMTTTASKSTKTSSSTSSGIPIGTLPHRPERVTPLIESAQTLRHDPSRHTRLDRQAIEAHYLRWVNSLDSSY